jgi:hypothetical protein
LSAVTAATTGSDRSMGLGRRPADFGTSPASPSSWYASSQLRIVISAIPNALEASASGVFRSTISCTTLSRSSNG